MTVTFIAAALRLEAIAATARAAMQPGLGEQRQSRSVRSTRAFTSIAVVTRRSPVRFVRSKVPVVNSGEGEVDQIAQTKLESERENGGRRAVDVRAQARHSARAPARGKAALT